MGYHLLLCQCHIISTLWWTVTIKNRGRSDEVHNKILILDHDYSIRVKKTKQVVVSILFTIYKRPAPCIFPQSRVKTEVIWSGKAWWITAFFEEKGGANRNDEQKSSRVLFISSVDVPLDFWLSHLLYPCSQILHWINSVFHISDCVTIVYFFTSSVVY